MPDSSSSVLWLPAALLGVGLAASSGLRTFLPLLLLAGAARFFGASLGSSFGWLASDVALASLAIATIVEIAGDKIPVVDHFLDTIGTLARPVAGALATMAVLPSNDPTIAALVGIVVGAPLALGVHGAKAGTRGISTATTMGVANPVISLVEDIAALFLGVVSLVAPLLVPVLLIFAGLLLWKVYKLARGLKMKRAREVTGE